MKQTETIKAYEIARERYRQFGVDTDAAIDTLLKKRISFNAWQLDDVAGFMRMERGAGGGIMATGNYMGAAKSAAQLMQDAEMVFSLLPGRHKLSLQANMVATEETVDLDAIEPRHFQAFVDWARERDLGLDINPSCSGHPMLSTGFTLSSADAGIRDFWIEHFIRTSEIGEYFGEHTGIRCVTNYWIPDGYKDFPADSFSPRKRLWASLDKIFSRPAKREYNLDTLESKLFGIGVEAYTVGSHEFYMVYGIRNRIPLCLDAGHFHLTEDVALKISSLLLGCDEILLHVTRPMRWDSDHVVSFDDSTQNIMNEIVRGGWLDRVNLGTDYFDASINRIAAGVLGMRNTQKALLKALLEPAHLLCRLENEGDYTGRLVLSEEIKGLPYAAVWDYVCEMSGVPVGCAWMEKVRAYEKEVLAKR